MNTFAMEGIIAAPALPMRPDYSIDWPTLRTYLRWVAAQKPTAIAMNMDASEGPSLDPDEQLEVLRVCKDVIGGTVPLVSGLIVGSTAADDDAPEIRGDVSLVASDALPQRVLAFDGWLDPSHAQAMEGAVQALRARGVEFVESPTGVHTGTRGALTRADAASPSFELVRSAR